MMPSRQSFYHHHHHHHPIKAFQELPQWHDAILSTECCQLTAARCLEGDVMITVIRLLFCMPS
jgi:hypothetical protein